MAKFHTLCDNKNEPTLFVAKSEHQRTFGGYVSVNWNKNLNG
jgi:hypothetical protein